MVTRSIKKLESVCDELTRRKEDIPARTQNRLAEEILDNRQQVEKNFMGMEEVGATLNQKEAEEDLAKMVSKVHEDIKTYSKKFKMF